MQDRIRKALKGSHEAVLSLYDDHKDTVWSLCNALLLEEKEADHATALIFKKVFEELLAGRISNEAELEAEENAAAGVDIMLSGHTHAGQLFPVGYLTDWIGGMNYGLYQTENCQSIVSSGFAGWGYGIRTQGHCEYVIVDIVPSAG